MDIALLLSIVIILFWPFVKEQDADAGQPQIGSQHTAHRLKYQLDLRQMFLQVGNGLVGCLLFIGVADGYQLLGKSLEFFQSFIANGFYHALLPAGGAKRFQITFLVNMN